MKDVKKSMEKHVLRKIKVFSDKQINNTILKYFYIKNLLD